MAGVHAHTPDICLLLIGATFLAALGLYSWRGFCMPAVRSRAEVGHMKVAIGDIGSAIGMPLRARTGPYHTLPDLLRQPRKGLPLCRAGIRLRPLLHELCNPPHRDSLSGRVTILSLYLRGVFQRAHLRYNELMVPRQVLFFGASLLLSLVAESLEQCPDLRVARAATWAEAGHRLADHTPDVLVFDISQDHESHILPLLFKNPNMLLIGLDPERNQAVLLSGQEAHSLTLHQLTQIVRGAEPRST